MEKTETGWLVRKSPFGKVIGTSISQVQAWQSARMRLFSETIKGIISEIPAVDK
jgi:hypothetical protein